MAHPLPSSASPAPPQAALTCFPCWEAAETDPYGAERRMFVPVANAADPEGDVRRCQEDRERRSPGDSFPLHLCSRRSLLVLDYRSNGDDVEFDAAAAQTPCPEVLLASEQRLSTLPDGILGLTALQRLHLGFNQLRTLPDGISGLTALQHLYLDNNELSTLPDGVSGLTALQRLHLDENQLSTLPDGISGLTALQHLELHYNQLSTLPDGISGLTALQHLDLGSNQLSTLPDGISGLTALQRLELHYNQLSTLPDGISALGGLVRLEQLSLAYNAFTSLPVLLSRLVSLTFLGIYGNRITGGGGALPPELYTLHQNLTGDNDAVHHTKDLLHDMHRKIGGPLPLVDLVAHWINGPGRRELFAAAADLSLPAELLERLREPRRPAAAQG